MARNFLQIAKDAYASSTSYVDSNYRKKWEDAICMFQSRHPQDSKYNADAYKHRSKLFRPKSRSMVRKHEAAASAAFFSNMDIISTDAVDQGNKDQVASAALMKEVLNYRLTKSIPWFQTIIGGLQDAMTVGVVCSYQYWKYRAKPTKEYQETIDEYGFPALVEVEGKEVIEDLPCIELMPVENIRIDPGASWIDPINTSPYVIRMIPMYVIEVKAKMKDIDSKTGQPKWNKLEDGQIRSAMKSSYDSTRQVREGNRQDSKEVSNAPITDFEIVWVHENFVRVDGDDVVYYTLGTEHMLTEAKPLKEVYFHGLRPIVMGAAVIETHKVMPDSPVMLGEHLQREANEIANSRIDNVKLVLNKRYIVKRGAQVDLKSLVRNVPASITLANDTAGDVRELNFADVTSSSYAEQDRINVDYDELTGNFSQGSVMTNRKMNETVGGMGMITGAANQMTEYTLRIFTETWVEPVLRQMVKLEQAYETDTVILSIAADRAQLWQKYGISEITDHMLSQDLTLTVNVGLGATDPNMKLQKFMGALAAYGQISQAPPPNIDLGEVGKEIFGLVGYRDGRRFMLEKDGEDPAMQARKVQQQQEQAMEAIQMLQQQLQDANEQLEQFDIAQKTAEYEIKNQETEIKAYDAETKRMQASQPQPAPEDTSQIEAMRLEYEDRWKQLEAETKVLVAQIQAQTSIQTASMTGSTTN